MKNKISSYKIEFILLLLIIFSLYTTNVFAHKSKKHVPGTKFDPVVCIPEEERTKEQIQHDSFANFWHRLSKLQQDCSIWKIQQLELQTEKQRQENEELEKKLNDAAICGDIYFNHKSNKDTQIYRQPKTKSKIIAEIKNGSDLLYISDSSKDNNWAFVLSRHGKICNSGYILNKLIVEKDDGPDIDIVLPGDLITILKPKWTKKEN